MNEADAKKIRARAYKAARRRFSRPDAEEIAQEVIKIFLKRGPGQTVAQAVSEVSKTYRKLLNRFIPVEAVKLDFLLTRAAIQERSAIFRDLVKNLHGEERAVLLLYFQLGFSPKEIADIFGVTDQSIFIRMRRYLKRLRESLKR